MPDISLDDIEKVTLGALTAHGAEPWIAAEVADAVREAEATGNRICGLYYLESYCLQLLSGRVKGHAVPVVSRIRPGAVHVNGGMGFAQPAFSRGLPEALRAASESGVASLAVGHTHTCTSLGYFTGRIARSGMIAFGMTNASPIVAGPGGSARVLGTNPIAFSVPDGKGGIAMQFDQSTTAVALGRITMAKAAGESIPKGWGVDSAGQPTTDPAAVLDGGALVSMGGYKGWGLGLMAELLTAGMAGGVLSSQVAPLKATEGAPHDLGQYYLLIDPAAGAAFADRFAALAETVAAEEGVRMPGRHRVMSDPVTVDADLWSACLDLAARDAS